MEGNVGRVWIGIGIRIGVWLVLVLMLAPLATRAGGADGGAVVISDPAGRPGDETGVQLEEPPRTPAVSAPADEPIAGSGAGFNSNYLFGLSRGLAASEIPPAVKPVLFIVTVPLDIALSPFALIGGLFG